MLKVSKNDFLDNDEFKFANVYLKDNITRISTKYKVDNEVLTNDELSTIKYNMICEITGFFLHISAIFTESDLKSLDKTESNLLILNRYLAIRQLVQDQIGGVLNGSWGLPKEITESEHFKHNISKYKCNILKVDFMTFLKE